MKKELKELIDRNDVISFDIFDTLILRNIFKPTDIFKILSNYAYEKFGIDNFFDIRIKAEQESRRENNNFESNFDEIYSQVLKYVKNKDYVKKLKKYELDLELDFCVYNPFMKEIYDYCNSKNKHIILISDMYLSKEFILKILNKNGYGKSLEIYVSNDFRANKGTGQLYDCVQRKNNFDKEKWLHIGDSINGDYDVPTKWGINAYLYPRVSSFVDLSPNSIFESILLGIQCNNLYNGNEKSYWEHFGIKCVSFIYFGFTKWLYDLTKHYDNLFFLARDGYMINKIYELFNSDNSVFTKYLYCSRKTLVVPSLILGSKDNLINSLTTIASKYDKISLKDFLVKAQIDYKCVDRDLIVSFGFETLDDYVSLDNLHDAKKLVATFYDTIKENLKNDYNNAVSYLKQEGVFSYDQIHVVDVGWGGSIQQAISKLTNKEVIGYYFGTIDLGHEDSFSNMFGYYFDLDIPKSHKDRVLKNVSMYELLFSAPHGSTISYEYSDGKYVPRFLESSHYNRVLKQFQEAAYDIILQYFKYINYFDSLSKDFCIYNFEKFLAKKDITDLKKFSGLTNDVCLNSSRIYDYVPSFCFSNIFDESSNFLSRVGMSLWNESFYLEDTDDMNDYLKARIFFNNMKYKDSMLIPLKCVKIYLDYGNGFNENDVMLLPYDFDGKHFSFKLSLANNIKRVRFDPVEGVKLKIFDLKIDSNKGSVNCFIPHKNYLIGKYNKCIFISSRDPKIILKDLNGVEWISFSAILEIVK